MQQWVIWKYRVPLEDEFTLEMPAGAEVLCVQIQGKYPADDPFVWALVNPSAPRRLRHFRLVGTGRAQSGHPGRYVGTFQLAALGLVFHLFDAGMAEEVPQ